MKFNVPSKTLHSYVSAVSKVISGKNALAVLNNFLFTLKGDLLTIRASDMENSLVGRLPVADSEGEGSFCLDARRIVDLLKELPDQGVTFEVNDDNLEVEITYPNGKFNTMALSGAEYPIREPEESEDSIKFTLEGAQLLHGIENTIFAVGADDLRPQMMGIYWDVKPDQIVFVATDTRKLVTYTDRMIKTCIECSFILPYKPAAVIKNVFGAEEAVEVELTQKGIIFTSPAYTLDCRQIEGKFPDYTRVIPKNNPYTLTVDRLSFLNAVRRVWLFGDSGQGLVKFKLSADNIVIRASDSGFGTSGVETVPCEFTGPEFTIGFSAPYLIDIFSTFTGSDVVMHMADATHPTLCLPAMQNPESELLVLLMPMSFGG